MIGILNVVVLGEFNLIGAILKYHPSDIGKLNININVDIQ